MNTDPMEIRRRLKEELAAARAEQVDRTSPHVVPLLTDRARLLGQLLVGACGPGGALVFPEKIGYGSEVVLEDGESVARLRIRLMSTEALDLGAEHVTMDSPVGRALLRRRAGDVVTFQTPDGPRRARVAAVETLPEFLERLAAERRPSARKRRTRPRVISGRTGTAD